MVMAYGFISKEYVNLGEGPHKNVVKTVVTQARLAEPVKVLRQQDGWYEVEMSDTYQGWVSPMDVVLTDKESWDKYQQSPQVLITAHFTYVYKNKDFCPQGKDASSLLNAVTMCTQLKLVAEESNSYQVLLPDGQVGYVKKDDGKVIPAFNQIPLGSPESIIALTKEFLGLPYFWGGTTPYGYDCSGMVQTIYKMNGIHVLRDAHQQYEMGDAVAKEDLQMGDMIFWSTYKEGASHVGFYIENGQYIHSGSSKGLAINSFNPSDENYSEDLDKKYLGARRIPRGCK